MRPERWQQLDQLFHSALQHEQGERAAFLDKACAGDDSLHKQVSALLAANEEAGSFIERPAMEVEARSVADDQNELAAGQTIGHYRIVSQLGVGGMGEVYLAEDTTLGRKVALKLLPSEFTKDADRLRRFQQEAHTASALNHPNIITIHEIGIEDNIRFIATEFIKGETLRERLQTRPIDIDETLNIASQIAAALDAAHQSGIVHRDIKPDNIMLREDGLVKVLDFGLAKLTETRVDSLIDTEATTRAQVRTTPGVVMGTVAYMSPEQARGFTVDARTDIFSFGAVLYEMLASKSPFAGETTSDIIAAILKAEPEPLSENTPPGLQPIVQKCLQKTADERYQTAKELLIDLNSLKHDLDFSADLERSGSPNRARGAGPTRKQGVRTTAGAEYIVSQVKLHKLSSAAVVGVLALAMVAGLLWYRNHTRAAPLTEQDTIVIADFVNKTGDPIFDGTLKQALAIQLEQSPFLNIFSDQRVREVLGFMNRSRDDRVTKDVAREICQRQGLKAYLAGTISNLGSHFVITLEALNAQTGDTIARQQVEAESKEQVLAALGGGATKLREKLGESLALIQKYDAPIQETTTSSLAALKAYTIAYELSNNTDKTKEAITYLERAVELDPNFAIAYGDLAVAYFFTRQHKLGKEAEQKAFDLRGRVSEQERLIITAFHYSTISETEKAIEASEQIVRTYPQAVEQWNGLGYLYLTLGQTEKAEARFRQAVRLFPNPYPFWGFGLALIRLNRFDEAKEVFCQGLNYEDHPFYHLGLYSIAFIQQDAGAMQQQTDWGSRRKEQFQFIWQGNAAAFSGQFRKSRELYYRGIEIEQHDTREYADKTMAARDAAWIAFREAVSGNCKYVKEDLAKSFAIVGGKPGAGVKWKSAVALAFCGETKQAQLYVDEVANPETKDPVVNAMWLPVMRAAIEIRHNRPDRAIEFLKPAKAYFGAGYDHQAPVILLWPEYLRGLAYLKQKAGAEAAAEFQTILDHRGMIPMGINYPLAHLGLARAAVLMGDTGKARKHYEDFFALWKDADSDIPILIEAKKEYARLN